MNVFSSGAKLRKCILERGGLERTGRIWDNGDAVIGGDERVYEVDTVEMQLSNPCFLPIDQSSRFKYRFILSERLR